MMARLLALASLLLPAFAAAAEPPAQSEFVIVMNVFVDVDGEPANSVGGAQMSRGWLTSWSTKASERREVTLQAVTEDGKRGIATTYQGCTLAGLSGLQGNSNVVGSIRLSCQR